MKRLIVLVVLIIGIGVYAAMNTIPQNPGARVSNGSVQDRAIQIATVAADAADPNYIEKTWTNALSLCTKIPEEWANISLSFYAYGDGDGVGDPNDADFKYNVYLVDYYGGMECLSSANIGKIGAAQLSHNPADGSEFWNGAADPNHCWADTITEGTKKTSSTIAYSDYAGTNGTAKMKFDRHSAFGIHVVIYDMSSESVTNVICIMNGFNR